MITVCYRRQYDTPTHYSSVNRNQTVTPSFLLNLPLQIQKQLSLIPSIVVFTSWGRLLIIWLMTCVNKVHESRFLFLIRESELQGMQNVRLRPYEHVLSSKELSINDFNCSQLCYQTNQRWTRANVRGKRPQSALSSAKGARSNPEQLATISYQYFITFSN